MLLGEERSQGCFSAAGLLALGGSRAARSPGLRRLGRSGRVRRSDEVLRRAGGTRSQRRAMRAGVVKRGDEVLRFRTRRVRATMGARRNGGRESMGRLVGVGWGGLFRVWGFSGGEGGGQVVPGDPRESNLTIAVVLE